MWLSAMLAEEYIRIDISLISCSYQLHDHKQALECTISFLSLPSDSTGLK
jgi:hypothetical protein